MGLPAQFQPRLELTNIVNSISQAVSALGSLALVDAIKKSGSDAITETKLASFIGRNRIDAAIKLHFREAVAKSDQSLISRYMDIVLESGAGPTVQEAMKNPALFSMVIQLSGLAFAHEDESLASATVEAMERIVRESGADVAIIPDYVSLLGTLRACQQQTVAFRWASVYEAVEHKIRQTLAVSTNQRVQKNSRAKKRTLNPSSITNPPCVDHRCLPFPVLQALLMWLHSLQNFPDHRILHLRCDSGVSTIVVWCYHILGLSITANLDGATICFGEEQSNIVIEEINPRDVGASLMDPADQHEPLFALASGDDNPIIEYEERTEAYGYGQRILKMAGLTEEGEQYCSQWIIARCLKLSTLPAKDSYKYPSEDSMIRAGRFLFGLTTVDREAIKRHTDSPFSEVKAMSRVRWPSLVSILIAFARLQEQELRGCSSMPLSLSACHSLRSSHQEIKSLDPEKTLDPRLNVSSSFENLAHLLLGHMFSPEYVSTAVLVSAWGWSIFVNSIEAVDPGDVSDSIRVMCGVPSRQGIRRARIIDGPTDLQLSSTLSETVNNDPQVNFLPGVSTAKRGIVMVGHHSDAFQITQTFTWRSRYEVQKMYKLGFREMQEMRNRMERFPACECVIISSDFVEQLDTSTNFLEDIDFGMAVSPSPCQKLDRYLWPRSREAWNFSQERVIVKFSPHFGREAVQKVECDKVYFFFVSDNAAARWLQLADMCAAYQEGMYRLFMRDRDTCIRCATRFCFEDPTNPTQVLL